MIPSALILAEFASRVGTWEAANDVLEAFAPAEQIEERLKPHFDALERAWKVTEKSRLEAAIAFVDMWEREQREHGQDQIPDEFVSIMRATAYRWLERSASIPVAAPVSPPDGSEGAPPTVTPPETGEPVREPYDPAFAPSPVPAPEKRHPFVSIPMPATVARVTREPSENER